MAQETAAETGKQPTMKRTVKDSVFANLFTDTKYLIKLYRALHPEDKKTEEKDIENVTIKNILTDQPYNDLGFRIGNTVLLLLEAQSTWTVNIIVRILMYLMQTYNDYCSENGLDLYGSTRVKLPKPELYVIFTGDRKDHPEYITLKDEFFGGQEVAVDAKVKIIYDGQPGDIINQYVTFTKVANDQMKKHGKTRKAVEETIRICIDEDVLTEYLKEREVEVMDIMTALFDEEEVSRRYGIRMQRENSEKIAKNLLAKGQMSIEDIADCTGLSTNEVEALSELALA
ncbi:MAG: hypothetical protein IJ608_05160 [Lachnospiraceae bacterium]|nr:hypothetical protein [Lachnospiraceae bacterium]